jgi:hypothetical protein
MSDVIYFFYGYIGNLQYCFEFALLRTHENIILANPLDGHMTCYLEAVPPKGALPSDGVNGWGRTSAQGCTEQRRGSSVTRPMRVVTVSGENRPARAHGGGASAPVAAHGGPHGLP